MLAPAVLLTLGTPGAVSTPGIATATTVLSSNIVPDDAGAEVSDGTWSVGGDIPPGVYRVKADVSSSACRWLVTEPGSSSGSGVLHYPRSAYPQITLRRGQGFTPQGCGFWAKIG